MKTEKGEVKDDFHYTRPRNQKNGIVIYQESKDCRRNIERNQRFGVILFLKCLLDIQTKILFTHFDM